MIIPGAHVLQYLWCTCEIPDASVVDVSYPRYTERISLLHALSLEHVCFSWYTSVIPGGCVFSLVQVCNP